MGSSRFKKYGRLTINKLDWLLAISCCIFAISSLWISLGISIVDGAPSALPAFETFARGLGFIYDTACYGQSAVVSVFVSVFAYGSLLLLILGTIFLKKQGLKGRVPGLVAELVAGLGFGLFLCFVYTYLSGESAGVVNKFWPASLIFFLVLEACIIIASCYLTFNRNFKIELIAEEEPSEAEEEEESEPVYEEIIEEEEKVEEEPEVKEEEPVEEEAEEIPEETTEEEIEEAEEELPEEEENEAEDLEENEEAQEGDMFSTLGPRRKRVPFENKVKRSKPETRARYKMIVTALRQYDFNDRKSIPCETFSYKKEKLIILTFSGQTLKAYFRLNPDEYVESPIPVKDVREVKKYEETPSCLIIKSDLAARRVILLAERIIAERNVPLK